MNGYILLLNRVHRAAQCIVCAPRLSPMYTQERNKSVCVYMLAKLLFLRMYRERPLSKRCIVHNVDNNGIDPVYKWVELYGI